MSMTLLELTEAVVDFDREVEHLAYEQAPLEIIIAMDGDPAGQDAARRSLEAILPHSPWNPSTSMVWYRTLMSQASDSTLRDYSRQRYHELLKKGQRREDGLEKAGDILALAEGLTKLTRRGRQWWGRCPFHREDEPSFSVDPAKGAWYCWGCQRGGGARALKEAIR